MGIIRLTSRCFTFTPGPQEKKAISQERIYVHAMSKPTKAVLADRKRIVDELTRYLKLCELFEQKEITASMLFDIVNDSVANNVVELSPEIRGKL